MTPTILYQDDDILLVNKPPGMVVNRAESVKGETVQEWVERELKNIFCHRETSEAGRGDLYNKDCFAIARNVKDDDFYSRAGIVHRIDKETSGILVIAKNSTSFIELQRQFKERLVKKTYLALVHGDVPQEGEIRVPVGRLPWNREQFGVVPGGKEAVTKFKRISVYTLSSRGNPPAGGDRSDLYDKDCFSRQRRDRNDNRDEKISLVEVYPETGRTHQIRVHFKYLGYPLVGDYLYAGRKQSRDDRKWAGRVMLHAWKITFSHPKIHETLAFVAPIPDDMSRIIKSEARSTKSEINSNA
ncbi:RluA family pseudouridine synthase [Patescibacteria group bacterium]|nr:RluA family pseudouridine synthase [Patescibacteria group bacterium]